MNRKLNLITGMFVALGLTACGSSSDSTENTTPDPTPEVGVIYGPFSTGTVQERTFAYFDVDTLSLVELTEEQAATDTTWDIAFKGSSVYLNTNDSEHPVSLYFTNNNSDFYDENGDPVVDKFINATAEDNLADFIAITNDNIPTDDAFKTDVVESILDGFYNYDSETHQITAADDHYFIAYSDTTVTKFRVTELTQVGYGMTNLTISYANQLTGATEFDTQTTELVIDATLECSNDDAIYIDFDVNAIVTNGDAWDIKIPCLASETDTAADFTLTLADDATAIQDFTNSYNGIPESNIPYYSFQPNEYSVVAFKENPWYQYNLEGGHKLWSQYGVYLLKNVNGVFKLQLTSYYDTDGNSGNYSLRVEAL